MAAMAVAAVAPWMVDKVAVKAAVVERGQAEMVPVKAAEKAVAVEKAVEMDLPMQEAVTAGN